MERGAWDGRVKREARNVRVPPTDSVTLRSPLLLPCLPFAVFRVPFSASRPQKCLQI
jgi:hypothetical protein